MYSVPVCAVTLLCAECWITLYASRVSLCFQSAQTNPHYADMFRGRPTRFVLPLAPAADSAPGGDLVTLAGTTATAHRRPDGALQLTSELLCDLGTETPRINYDRHNGAKYRYFYAISSDVDGDNPGKVSRQRRAKWRRQFTKRR